MLVKLLRQMLSPLRRFSRDVQYREWLRLSDKLHSVLPETPAVVNVSGLKIQIADAGALLNMYENIFLNRCYAFTSSASDPLIIDCGANIGLSTLWFARNYPMASIIAFEPDSHLFELLRENVKANNIKADIRNEAVWNENTVLRFESGKKQGARISEKGNTSVKAVRLKEILESFGQVDLLKLDIEGAEYNVIHDCRCELHKIRNLFVEFHFCNGDISQALAALQTLQDSGFRCRIQSPFQKMPFLLIREFQTLDVYAVRNKD